jgi:hypothetical protein
MDDVAKVVLLAALEVGDEVVDVHRVRLEGPPRREVEVADAACRRQPLRA